jgi:hypothetical protein
MRVHPWRLVLLGLAAIAGCTAPLTVAEPRDAGGGDDAGVFPREGGIEPSDAADEPPLLSDPPDDAGAG